jgi:hypothetical protein
MLDSFTFADDYGDAWIQARTELASHRVLRHALPSPCSFSYQQLSAALALFDWLVYLVSLGGVLLTWHIILHYERQFSVVELLGII